MASNHWDLYQRHASFVLGFHGSDQQTVDEVVSGKLTHLKRSEGRWEWLGHGVYFWENDPERAFDWARHGNSKSKISEPAAVGAVIDLGLCLDLTTLDGLNQVREAYQLLKGAYKATAKPMPINDGGSDNPRRELDCQVIQSLHKFRSENDLPPYDSVRAFFPEEQALYPNAGFLAKSHVQICVRQVERQIKGYFMPIRNG